MSDHEFPEISESQAALEVNRLLNNHTLLTLGSRAQSLLGHGTGRFTKPTISDLFQNGRVIHSALVYPELTRQILTQSRNPEQRRQHERQAPKPKKDTLKARADAGVARDELISTTLYTSVLERSSENLERDMHNRAIMLASLFAEFDIIDSGITKQSSGQTRDLTSIAHRLLRRYHNLAEAVPKSFPEPLNGRGAGSFIETVFTETSRPTDYTAGLDDRTSGIFGPHLRDRFCREYYGDDYDGYAIEDYRGDGLLQCTNPITRGVFLNNPASFSDAIDRHPLWQAMTIEQEKFLPAEPSTDIYTAALNPKHPRYQAAHRILRKYIFATKPEESVSFLTHITANGDDVSDPVSNYRNFGLSLIRPDALERQKRIGAMLTELYGVAGKDYYDAFVNQFKRYGMGDGKLQAAKATQISPRSELEVRQHRNAQRPYLRVVEHIPQTDEHIGAFIPELSIEQEQGLTPLTTAMVADIRESTVALTPLQRVTGDTLMQIIPKPDNFPAMEIVLTNDEFTLTITLDPDLEIVSPATDIKLQRMAIGIRAQALALIHDELLAVQEITCGSRTTPAGVEKTPSDTKPTRRPTRVHRTKKFLVFGEAAEDEDLVHHQVTNVSGDQAMLTVDRRPHWSDRAPQLTTEARRHALNQWLTANEGKYDNLRPVLENALLQETAHRLSIRRILTGLFEQERQRRKMLPNDFPLHDAIENLTTNTEERYQVLLQEYTYPNQSTDQAAAGPLPNIYRMSERMAADQRKMQEFGIEPMSIPDRMKPTETYMPFARYQTPFKLDSSGFGRIKQYTVIRSNTAFESVQKIIKGEIQPTNT
ncbi:MAG: hypothetical protein ACD_43C00240G0004 [uncultured bacterium]|nr:MAG: hypothetical protein ACD_43C00240G0004 [uncultured bacterium]